ncbi:glutamate--tRNA ligase [Hyphobacterium marinum]|uniref:Glutamate--tRNA ligase n=1 Tax=Hyphobacterium marinum TaxID=3116574 RepID=A0ABU7M164_9PROT|nr:glutamate--tRNA ligase [Hyphobacterium sp. Y6023]MEE2567523.1 glutamate--tRNA ligase [Hyphobacterium sp. Y6023]
MQNKQTGIVTRFAPSPTGYLHIGGARTALFNWLFARGQGGQFLLRIEDTDRARSTEDAVEKILEGLQWLGLDWDGEPVSQHARAARHRAVVDELVAAGAAFRCYCTPDEVTALRETAFAEGRALRSPWRDRPDSDAPADAPHVVRFRAPDSDVVIADAVQGDVRWKAKEFDDLVLLRTDGAPTYNLAVVADDHDMGVTHIIRGDDHLTNAARQSQIYDALGWDRPVFAHIPLIHGPDGKKLSKRHGALGVEAYRDMGYLPAGLRNYLLRLGWSKGDQEYFSDAEAKAAFSLDGLNKAPARLDFDKMGSVNATALRESDDTVLTDALLARLEAAGTLEIDAGTARERLLAGMGVLKTRAKTLAELEEQTYFLTRRSPFAIEGKAAKPLDDDALARLGRLHAALAALADWSEENLAAALKSFAEAEAVGFGKIGQPLRAALTGGAPAPDLSAVMLFLGRTESLDRIHQQAAAG